MLLGSPARAEDDSRAAWSEVGSPGDRYDLKVSRGRVLGEYSSGLHERGRALRADSIVLMDSATAPLANSRMLRATQPPQPPQPPRPPGQRQPAQPSQ